MDITIETWCPKFCRKEHVYLNFVGEDLRPNVCENGDGGEICAECLTKAIRKYLEAAQD